MARKDSMALAWSHRRCTGPAFRKALIFPDLSCLLLIHHVARESQAI
jgi:hypothetical protein